MKIPILITFLIAVQWASAYRFTTCSNLQDQYDVIKDEVSKLFFVLDNQVKGFDSVYLQNTEKTQIYVCKMKKSMEQVKRILEDCREGGPGFHGNALKRKWIAILSAAIASYAPYCTSRLQDRSSDISSAISEISHIVRKLESIKNKMINIDFDGSCDDLTGPIKNWENEFLGHKNKYQQKLTELMNMVQGPLSGGQKFGRCMYPPCGSPPVQPPAYGAPQAPAYGAPQAPVFSAPAYGAPAYGAPQVPKAPAYGAPQAPAYGAPAMPHIPSVPAAYAPAPVQSPPSYYGRSFNPFGQQQPFFGGESGPITSIKDSMINTGQSSQNVNGLLIAAGLQNTYMSGSKAFGVFL